jgi:hypothetical protein
MQVKKSGKNWEKFVQDHKKKMLDKKGAGVV